MPIGWSRRRLLGSFGALVATGCLGPDLPAGCPTTNDLGVPWPDNRTASTVATFVEAYEHVYHREVIVAYEPRSRLDTYELSGSVTDTQKLGEGYEVAYTGSGAVYTPTLLLGARVADPPDGADVVTIDAIDDRTLTETLDEAAENGEATHHVDRPGPEVDRYIERFESLSSDFEPLSGPGDSDTLYVDNNGTTIELTVQADRFHGDYRWNARYYVNEHVVRRTTDETADPRDGDLLECRREV